MKKYTFIYIYIFLSIKIFSLFLRFAANAFCISKWETQPHNSSEDNICEISECEVHHGHKNLYQMHKQNSNWREGSVVCRYWKELFFKPVLKWKLVLADHHVSVAGLIVCDQVWWGNTQRPLQLGSPSVSGHWYSWIKAQKCWQYIPVLNSQAEMYI